MAASDELSTFLAMAASDESPTVQFDASHPLGRFLVSTGLPSKVWKTSIAAHKSEKPFIFYEIDHVVYFAFTGSDAVDDFLTVFGEENIMGNHLFTTNDNAEPALVNSGLLRGFLNLLQNSDFQEKVEWSEENAEGVVFTGHCLGGAMAALATLWMLLRLNADKSQTKTQTLPFCVTFGCPLLGDEGLELAVRKKKWHGQFCHIVSKHDILPRVLLAPFPSIYPPLKALIPYFYSAMQPCSGTNGNNWPCFSLSNDQTRNFLVNVMHHAQTAATSSSTETGWQSPYKPFGYYLLCSEKGAACIESSVAVLQMLYFTLQDMDLSSHTFLKEHIDYGKTVEHNLKILTSDRGLGRGHTHEKEAYELGITIALEAAGIDIQNAAAQHTLINTGRIGLRPSLNSAQLHVQSAKIQGARVELEWYKTSCERDGIGYYDSFKKPSKPKDFRANIDRIKISRFWDDFVHMVEMNELIDDELKWVYTGAYYRQLVEPLDVAFYYRSGKHKKQGHYLQGGRPRRYEILEKWFEDFNLNNERVRRTRLAVVTQDSCFWARLEEAQDWLDIIKEERDPAVNAELMNKIEGFVNHVHQLVKARDISRDVLLEESSFIKWWKEYRRMHTDFLSFSSHAHPTQLQLTEIENEIRLCIMSDPMIRTIL